MADIKTDTLENFLNGMKGWISDNGSQTFYGGWGAHKRDASHEGTVPGTLKAADGKDKPWHEFLTAHDIMAAFTDWANQDASEVVRDFFLEPAPEHWWNNGDATYKHPPGLLFKQTTKNNPYLNFKRRKAIGKPITRLEYWSLPIVSTHDRGMNDGYYHGIKIAGDDGKTKLFNHNVLNMQACKHSTLFGSFSDLFREKAPSEYTEKDWEFLEIVQLHKNAASNVRGHSPSNCVWSIKSNWEELNMGYSTAFDGILGYIVFRMVVDKDKRANPFQINKLGVLEKAVFSDADGNLNLETRKFDKGLFYAEVQKYLTKDDQAVWLDGQDPPYGDSTPTPKVKVKYGEVVPMKGPTQAPEHKHPDVGSYDNAKVPKMSTSYNTFVGLWDSAGTEYSDMSAHKKKFYDWLVPVKYGQTYNEDRRSAYKSAFMSVLENPRFGALKRMDIAKDFGWFSDGDKDLGVKDLSRYDWDKFIDWNQAVNNYNNAPLKKAHAYLPKTVKTSGTRGGEYEFTGKGATPNINFPADIRSFNSSAKIKGNLKMKDTHGTTEGSKKVIDTVKKAFNDYVGDPSTGISCGDAKHLIGEKPLLGTQWFADSFKSGLIPNDSSMLTFKIQLNTTNGDSSEWFSDTQRAALNKLLPGIDTITFEHGSAPWQTVYKNPKNNKHEIATLPLEDLLDAYYTMSYLMYVFYREEIISNIKNGTKTEMPSLTSTDFMQWYAVKAAFHYRRTWEVIMQSHYTANVYSLYVLVAALGVEDEVSEDLLNTLANLVEDAADDLTEDVGLQGLPTSVVMQEQGLSEASKEQRERFYKQCALMLNMHKLDAGNQVDDSKFHNKSKAEGYTSYNGRVHLVQNKGGKNTNIINKLTSPRPEQMKEFIDVDSKKASELTPFIRIYKVYNHSNTGRGLEGNLEMIEIPFELNWRNQTMGGFHNGIRAAGAHSKVGGGGSRLNDQRIGAIGELRMESEKTGGASQVKGAGLKEFTWEYDGETPATASKYVKAKLHLFFSDFNEFIRERFTWSENPEVHQHQDGPQWAHDSVQVYSYVDLFVSPSNMVAKSGPSYNAPHHLRYEPDYYRIRVDVGWNESSVHSKGLNDAIAAQNTSFYLVLVDHEININEDMTVDITANYRAYIEEAVDSQKFNALNSPEVKKMRDQHMAMWDQAIKDKEAGSCSAQELNRVRAAINGQMANLVKKQHKSIMTNLLREDRVFFVDFDPPEIDNFRQNGSFGAIPTFKKVSFKDGGLSNDAKQHLLNVTMAAENEPWSEHATPSEGLRVYYFYLGDLIYLLMSNLYKGDKPWESSGIFADEGRMLPGAERTKMLLTDFDYDNILSKSQTRHTINIADIPISVDYFFDWYVDNIIKNDVTQMPIGTFIRKILTELITEAMAEVCITGVEGHYVTFQLGSFVAAPKLSTDGIYMDPIAMALAINKKDIPDPYEAPPADEAGSDVQQYDSTGQFPQSSQDGSEYDVYETDDIDDEFGESVLDESATEENIQAAAALADAGGFDAVTGGVLENENTGNPYRFDVNEWYGMYVAGDYHLPLPRLPAKDAQNEANSQYNYLMIYGDFADPYHSGEGNKEADEAAGTYHLELARDRGLLKKISFSKNNIPYHRESRMFNQGQAGNLQLSAVYDCQINMIGNTLFLPGMEVYIDPYGFGGENFGQPYERPLEHRSPSAAAIRKFNAHHADSMVAGSAGTGADAKFNDGQAGQSVAELEALAEEADKLEAHALGEASVLGHAPAAAYADHKRLGGYESAVAINSYANLMGIGGYQLITGISCTIAPGKYETVIKAKHTYTGYPQIQQSQKLIEFRKNQSDINDVDINTTNACVAIIKQQEMKFRTD